MAKMGTIGVITALPDVELRAVRRAIPVRNARGSRHEGERYWEAELFQTDGHPLRIVMSSVGESGNIEIGLPVERMIRYCDPELMIFVGIACGVRDYRLGDVVTSSMIWAYEYVKTQKSGLLDRSRARVTPGHVQDDVHFFDADMKREWHKVFKKVQSKTDGKLLPRNAKIVPELHKSIWIASGEKVMGAGELAELNKKHDLIRAGDMEGYGFANACEDRRLRVPWLVIRGISDYGDRSKDGLRAYGPKHDEFHATAANAASSFLKVFLQHSYRTQDHGAVVSAQYSSSYDPDFQKTLRDCLASAKDQIILAGMGLKFLRGNPEFMEAIGQAMSSAPALRVTVCCADPNTPGVIARVNEEAKVSRSSGRAYRRSWPRIYGPSIRSALKRHINRTCQNRFSFRLVHFMPTLTVIAIDELRFFAPFGTPDIHGSESPWFLIYGSKTDGPIIRFLNKCTQHFVNHSSKG